MSTRIDALLKLIDSDRDSAVLRFGLAQALFNEQRYLEAVDHLLAAVAFDSGYSAAWKLLGKAHIANSDWQAAQRAYQQGMDAAQANGDQQAAKEMAVFLKRISKHVGSA
jgi:predicted Zn-dependent protease